MTVPIARGGTLIRLLEHVGAGRLADRVAEPGGGVERLEDRLLLSATLLGGYGGAEKALIEDVSAASLGGAVGIEVPPEDHGGDAATATSTLTNTTVFGEIETAGDQDWFSFLGQTGIQYTFASELITLPDSQLVVYDKDGITVLAFDDDSGDRVEAEASGVVMGVACVAIRAAQLAAGQAHEHARRAGPGRFALDADEDLRDRQRGRVQPIQHSQPAAIAATWFDRRGHRSHSSLVRRVKDAPSTPANARRHGARTHRLASIS